MGTVRRRSALQAVAVAAAALASGGCSSHSSNTSPGRDRPMPQRYTYGNDPSQYAELYLPDQADLPADRRHPPDHRHPGVVVIIHGGYWRAQYGAELGRPLAEALAVKGYTCWNLEYRRVGNGGGWPATFDDVAAGIDKLTDAAREHSLDLGTVTALGHSAGGHLAVWAAGRGKLPPGTPGAAPKVLLTGVVSQSGVLDLAMARKLGLSNGAAENLLGVPPEGDPRRWELADPLMAVPLDVPVLALHGTEDTTVPLRESESYVEAAIACGARAELISIPGDHFAMITPGTDAWELVVKAVGTVAEEPGSISSRSRE